MLLAAMRAQAAAATTAATTATAATASAEAVEVDDSTSAEFDASDKPKMPLALNKVLNESDIAAARDLISQVGVGAGGYCGCVVTLCAAHTSGLVCTIACAACDTLAAIATEEGVQLASTPCAASIADFGDACCMGC